MPRALSLWELNRATLARQMLLDREDLPVYDAVRRLAGLQAQVPNPPYIGLWTRLRGFERKDLTGLMEERRVVRAPLMRSTLKAVFAAVELGRDGEALNYAVRAHLPIVQVPPGGTWGSGAAAYATAESRLGRPPSDPAAALRALLFRYLAAFGPASVKDFQTWSGLVRPKDPVEELKENGL
jgi:hypothetical protein